MPVDSPSPGNLSTVFPPEIRAIFRHFRCIIAECQSRPQNRRRIPILLPEVLEYPNSPMRTTLPTEYRFAIVMYGGVSLAVYMNGITQELLSLVRSTAQPDATDTEAQKAIWLESTDGIYRNELAGTTQHVEDDGKAHVRFVIDIISGTSAGGINGVFLAKALTARKDLTSLKQTWIEEADFGKLLNDDRAPLRGLPVQDPPRSLLNGERMYIKLFEALAKMDDAKPRNSYVDEISLWVTTTDLIGRLTPLRLSEKVWEREYRTVFNFLYSSDNSTPNHFAPRNTPFLAFAARCTSSFPVAFEPMQLASIQRLLRFSPVFQKGGDYDQKTDVWTGFFPGQEDPQISDSDRFFADGGYLDNHPFDHAIQALNRQPSHVRTLRKLLYIEPSPQNPELDHPGVDKDGKAVQPDAIDNAWDGLAGIPGQQPIQDSLIQIQKRNRTIRKVNEVILEISADVEESEIFKNEEEGSAKNAVNRASKQRIGFHAYTALNVYAVTDDLALRIARLSGIEDQSDFVYAIRCLIKVWRKETYQGENKDGQFLLDFDISYRMRRYQFVKNQLQALSCLDETAMRKLTRLNGNKDKPEILLETELARKDFRKEIARVREVFDASFRILRQTSLDAQQGLYGLEEAVNALGIGRNDLEDILDGGNVEQSSDIIRHHCENNGEDLERKAAELLAKLSAEPLDRLAEAIKNAYRGPIGEARDLVAKELSSPGDEKSTSQRGNVLRLAKLYFYGFQEFDAAIFPITYGTDVGELDPVEVIRISPQDATTIVDEKEKGAVKLAGTAYGNFGAFLESAWRRNDILWGRLDGAERIITVLAGRGEEAIALLRRAQEIILAEELKSDARTQLCQVLVDSLLRTSPGPISKEKQEEVLNTIATCMAEKDLSGVDRKLRLVMAAVLTPAQIRTCLESYSVSREPDRETMLRNISRSSSVIGKMLQGTADRRTMLKKPGAVLAQAGGAFWILVEAAVPQTLFSAFAKYWSGLVLLFGAVMIVAGLLLGSSQTGTLGWEIVAIALAWRLVVALLRSWIGAGRWKMLIAIILAIPIGILLLLGIRDVSCHFLPSDTSWLHSVLCRK